MPIEGKEFGLKVEEYLKIIKTLPGQPRHALRAAYIFSRKVPKAEREDMFQELCLAVLKVNTDSERFAYAIARCDWRNWWQKYMTRQHYFAGSINQTVLDSDNQEVELSELLVGECEFERRMDGKLDAERIWGQLPDIVKPSVQKRLEGKPLTKTEQKRLERYVAKTNPMILA